jgi:hypothetical protein
MAHFVNISGDRCSSVIVIANDDCDNLPFPESEPVGQAYIETLGLGGEWLQTSYNGNFRGCYAGIGYTYDATLGEYGEFIPPPHEAPIEP